MSCSVSRADPAEQPTPIEKLFCEDPLKLDSTSVEYLHISQNQSSVPSRRSIRLATATHLSQALCQHAEVLHQEHRFQWMQGGVQGSRGHLNSLPLSCAEKADRSLLMTCTSCCEVSYLDVKTGRPFEPCRIPI